MNEGSSHKINIIKQNKTKLGVRERPRLRWSDQLKLLWSGDIRTGPWRNEVGLVKISGQSNSAKVMRWGKALLWVTGRRMMCWEASEEWGGAEEMRSEGWHQAVYEEGPCDNEELEFFRGQSETTKKSFKKRNGRVWYMLLKRSLTPNSCLDHPSLTHPRGWHNLINKTSDRAQRGEKAHRTDPSPNKSPSCWFSSPEICVVLSFFFVFLNSWLNLMFPPNPNLQGV